MQMATMRDPSQPVTYDDLSPLTLKQLDLWLRDSISIGYFYPFYFHQPLFHHSPDANGCWTQSDTSAENDQLSKRSSASIQIAASICVSIFLSSIVNLNHEPLLSSFRSAAAEVCWIADRYRLLLMLLLLLDCKLGGKLNSGWSKLQSDC